MFVSCSLPTGSCCCGSPRRARCAWPGSWGPGCRSLCAACARLLHRGDPDLPHFSGFLFHTLTLCSKGVYGTIQRIATFSPFHILSPNRVLLRRVSLASSPHLGWFLGPWLLLPPPSLCAPSLQRRHKSSSLCCATALGIVLGSPYFFSTFRFRTFDSSSFVCLALQSSGCNPVQTHARHLPHSPRPAHARTHAHAHTHTRRSCFAIYATAPAPGRRQRPRADSRTALVQLT